jgi:hypothetical protein
MPKSSKDFGPVSFQETGARDAGNCAGTLARPNRAYGISFRDGLPQIS